MDIRDTIKATNTAIATVDLVKDYGSGNNTDACVAWRQRRF